MGDPEQKKWSWTEYYPTASTGRERPQAPETGTGAGECKKELSLHGRRRGESYFFPLLEQGLFQNAQQGAGEGQYRRKHRIPCSEANIERKWRKQHGWIYTTICKTDSNAIKHDSKVTQTGAL